MKKRISVFFKVKFSLGRNKKAQKGIKFIRSVHQINGPEICHLWFEGMIEEQATKKRKKKKVVMSLRKNFLRLFFG